MWMCIRIYIYTHTHIFKKEWLGLIKISLRIRLSKWEFLHQWVRGLTVMKKSEIFHISWLYMLLDHLFSWINSANSHNLSLHGRNFRPLINPSTSVFLSLEVLQSSCFFRCGWTQPGGSKQHALVELLPPSGWALCSVKAVWDYGSLILSGYQAKPSVLKIYYNVLKLCGAKILSLKTVIY